MTEQITEYEGRHRCEGRFRAAWAFVPDVEERVLDEVRRRIRRGASHEPRHAAVEAAR